MIGASRKLLFIAAAMLVVVTLSVGPNPPGAAPKLPEAASEPPVDAPAYAPPNAPANEPVKVGWHLLASLNYRTGEPGQGAGGPRRQTREGPRIRGTP